MEARRLKGLDRTLAALSALTAAVSAALIVGDVHLFVRDAPARAAEPRVAALTRVEETVRRRPRDLPMWSAAATAEALFHKDAVFTDQGSGAVLTFEDGSVVELGENTLVSVEKVEAKPVLGVIRGTLRARTAGGDGPLLKTGSGTPVAIGAASEMTLVVREGGEAEVTVVRGAARVGAGGVAIGPAETTRVTGGGAVEAPRPVAITLLAPAHDAEGERDDGGAVRFAWRAGGGASEVLEVARDEAFRRVVARREGKDGAALVTGLAEGRHYWRVRSGAATSETRRVTLARHGGLALYGPGAGEAFAGKPVRFLWESAGPGRAYELEIARDGGFGSVVERERRTAAHHEVGALAPGTYHWRVREAGGTRWSEARTFLVVAATEAPNAGGGMPAGASSAASEDAAAAPAAVAPDAEGPLAPDAEAPAPSEASAPAEAADAPASGAEPTGAPDTMPVLDAPVLPRRIEIELPDATRQRTRLHRLLDLLEGLVVSTASAADEAGVVTWPDVAGAAGYRVEIAKDQAFREVVSSRDTRTASVALRGLAPGRYWLRVAAVDERGRVGRYSDASELVVRRRDLAAPRLVAPAEDAVVEVATPLPVVGFGWEPVPGAATYTFQVAKAPDFARPVFEKRTRGTDLNVELAPGTYWWRMRSLRRPTDDAAWGSPRAFEVRRVEPAPKATLVQTSESTAKAALASTGAADARDDGAEEGKAGSASINSLALRVAFAPTVLRYDTTAAGASIDAVLFNSVAASGRLWLGEGFAVDAAARRAATVLFRERSAGDPPEQTPLVVQPFTAEGAARWRLLGSRATRHALDLRLGYGTVSVPRLNRNADQTLAARHVLQHGPLFGVGVELPLLGRLGARVGVDYLHAVAAGGETLEAGRRLQAEALATLELARVLRLEGGIAYGRDVLRLGDGLGIETRAYSALVGAALELESP